MKICEDNNAVIFKYPFLKDSVEFLTAIIILIIMIKLSRYTGVNVERVKNKDRV